MEPGGPKDNANPVVVSVDDGAGGRRGGSSRRQTSDRPFGWSEIAAISCDCNVDGNEGDDDELYYDNGAEDDDCDDTELVLPQLLGRQRRPEDRAVVLALSDVAMAASSSGASSGAATTTAAGAGSAPDAAADGVSLLRRAGVAVADTPARRSKALASSVPAVSMSIVSKDDKEKENVAAGSAKKAAAANKEKETDNAASVDSNAPPAKKKTKKTRDRMGRDEVFEIVRNIQDPEHPLTLEQLAVVSREQISVHDVLDDDDECEEERGEGKADGFSTIDVRFTPTVPHCSMATLIGLSLRVKLLRSVPPRFKVKVSIEPGTHQSESAVNKQLDDKERVCAALENPHLCKVVNRCIGNGMKQ